MIISYDIGDSSFDFETDLSNFIDSLPDAQKVVLAKALYENLDDDIKAVYNEEYNVNFPEDFDKTSDSDVIEASKNIIENAEDSEIYDNNKETIDRFYEDDAIESYLDATAYEKDPYGYNGVRPSDFY